MFGECPFCYQNIFNLTGSDTGLGQLLLLWIWAFEYEIFYSSVGQFVRQKGR
jgi:hypothetical protein